MEVGAVDAHRHSTKALTPFPHRGIAYAPPSLVGTFRRAGRGEGGSPGGPCRLPGTARGR